MKMFNKTKIRCSLFLIGMSIFNSNSMEKNRDEINSINNLNDINTKINTESIENEINKDKRFISFEILEEKLIEDIKNLKEDFKINEIYETNYNDELKNIVDILNNLKYSHQYKFNTEKGIEELKCIYGILCEKILKLSTYLYYDKKGNFENNKEVLEKVLKPLIEREKTIAKNNHFETDFFMMIIYVNIFI